MKTSFDGGRERPSLHWTVAGTAALEFGLIAPVLVTLMLGTVDLGMMANQAAVLDAAVRAGVEYARTDPTNTTQITSIVTGYTTFAQTVTVTFPTSGNSTITNAPLFCECDTPGTSTPPGTSTACDSPCATGPTHSYVTVKATQPFTPLIPFTPLVLPTTGCPTAAACIAVSVTTRVS